MPNDAPHSEPESLTPRYARFEAQLMLGQIHGLVWLAAKEADIWLPLEDETERTEPGLTAEDIRRAAAEVDGHFGTVHAALNTGAYDEELVKVGFTGAQGQAKKKGFLRAIKGFFARGAKLRNYVERLRGALRWSATLNGSISAALKKEIERVPGAGLAAEAIKEFIEVLLNATEPVPELPYGEEEQGTREPSREKQKAGAERRPTPRGQ
jgi:hypothetical protein